MKKYVGEIEVIKIKYGENGFLCWKVCSIIIVWGYGRYVGSIKNRCYI